MTHTKQKAQTRNLDYILYGICVYISCLWIELNIILFGLLKISKSATLVEPLCKILLKGDHIKMCFSRSHSETGSFLAINYNCG